MDSSMRGLFVGMAAIAIALMIFLPNLALLILFCWILTQGGIWVTCMRRVNEPERAIILRYGHIHHLSPSGIFFMLPWAETMGDLVNMKPESQEFTITQLHAGDGEGVYMNLELTWRIRPDLDTIDEQAKQFLLKTPDQRKTYIEHSVNVVARQLVQDYTSDQLKRADARERAIDIIRTAINEMLEPSGVMIDSLFWRGSSPAKELNDAKLKVKIAHEQVQGMLTDIEAVRERLPDVPAQEFLTYQAWIELIRRGVSPPGAPNMPQFPLNPTPPASSPKQ